MHRLIAASCAAAVLTTTSACSLTESNGTAKSGPGGPVKVDSSDSGCSLSTTKATSGRLVFRVKNTGTKVTEFYVYDKDGSKIVAEVENIGPGLTRDLVLTAAPGTYVTSCKPGMTGNGIRADFTVGDSGQKVSVKGLDQSDIDAATAAYKSYVQQQSDQLLTGTRAFAAAYVAGDRNQARALYTETRTHWERIEPVAESFGDLDPKMDLRQANLEQGQPWTGWHRIEKDLWPATGGGVGPMRRSERKKYANDLAVNTVELGRRIAGLDFTIDQIGNGSKSLLDEVASTKITGEEEIFSHTDLSDIEANVEGAKKGFEAVEDLLKVKDPALYESIETQFGALGRTLDRYRTPRGGFVPYDRVTAAQRKSLSDAVNALAEPLSKMTGAITL